MKQLIVPICFAISGFGFLLKGLVKPLADSQPLDYSFVVIAAMMFTLGVVNFTNGRKPAG